MKRILEIFIATCLVLALAVGTWLLVDADSFENIFIKNEQNTPSTDEQQPINPDAPTPDLGGGEEQPLVCIITFKDDAKTLSVVNIANGALITSPTDPVKEGYIFLGWAIEGTNSPADFTSLIASTDMTFIALWEKENKVTPASSFTFNGNTITGYVGEDADVVIPESYSLDSEGNPIDGEDIQVTVVGDAFKYNENVKSVVIPEGVTSVGSFSCCSALESVTIPASVTTLKTFYSCSSLKELNIPEGVTFIGSQFVQSCSALKAITLPTTLVSIGESAFWGCTTLQEITIPEGIKKIPAGAFTDCLGLTSITIPASVTVIAENSFSGCKALESMIVAIGNSVYDSRNNCNAIMETATNTLIAGCKNTVIQASTQAIGAYAFYNITLTEMDIPEGVATIGYYAFYNSKLKTVAIPASVTKIENLAFGDYTTKLIFVAGSAPAEIESKSFTTVATIYVPDDEIDTYKSAWTYYAGQIKPYSEYVEAE